MIYKAIKQAGKNMGYINAILVLTIAFQVGKLYLEYKEMGQSRNTKKKPTLISGQAQAN